MPIPAERAQALSAQRAEAVAAEMRRGGVPASRIQVQGHGNARPIVQAQRGTREPQNRRVEIVIR